MRFDEEPERMRRKLEEMTTISSVHVDLDPYPSNSSGGWGGVAVDDGTPGGYTWKVTLEHASALYCPDRSHITLEPSVGAPPSKHRRMLV